MREAITPGRLPLKAITALVNFEVYLNTPQEGGKTRRKRSAFVQIPEKNVSLVTLDLVLDDVAEQEVGSL